MQKQIGDEIDKQYQENDQIITHSFQELFKDRDIKMYILYFGGYWCPQSRAFTEKIQNLYNLGKVEDKKLYDIPYEFVQIGTDKNETDQKSHLKRMTFPGVKQESPVITAAIKKQGVKMIPTVQIVDGVSRKIISDQGREMIEKVRSIEESQLTPLREMWEMVVDFDKQEKEKLLEEELAKKFGQVTDTKDEKL